MKTTPRPPPSDSELDQLLRSQLTRTSPEFERRWRELRNGFVTEKRAFTWWRPWLIWPGLAVAAAAVMALTVIMAQRDLPAVAATAPTVAFEELFAWDSALAAATPLLTPENREALLNLPAPANL